MDKNVSFVWIYTTIDFLCKCFIWSSYSHVVLSATAADSRHILWTPTWSVRGLCYLRAKREPELTVVVLTRPPGCVQVQPDLLTNRSQPSSSKHGTISHHCFFRTIPAAEENRKKERKIEPLEKWKNRRNKQMKRNERERWMQRCND